MTEKQRYRKILKASKYSWLSKVSSELQGKHDSRLAAKYFWYESELEQEGAKTSQPRPEEAILPGWEMELGRKREKLGGSPAMCSYPMSSPLLVSL